MSEEKCWARSACNSIAGHSVVAFSGKRKTPLGAWFPPFRAVKGSAEEACFSLLQPRPLISASERRRQTAALINCALGIQLRRHVGATNDVDAAAGGE